MLPNRKSLRQQKKSPEFGELEPVKRPRTKRKKNFQSVKLTINPETGDYSSETETESDTEQTAYFTKKETVSPQVLEDASVIASPNQTKPGKLNRTKLLPFDPALSASILQHSYIPNLDSLGDEAEGGTSKSKSANQLEVTIPNTSQKVRKSEQLVDDYATPVPDRTHLTGARRIHTHDDDFVTEIRKLFKINQNQVSTVAVKSKGNPSDPASSLIEIDPALKNFIDYDSGARKEAFSKIA